MVHLQKVVAGSLKVFGPPQSKNSCGEEEKVVLARDSLRKGSARTMKRSEPLKSNVIYEVKQKVLARDSLQQGPAYVPKSLASRHSMDLRSEA
jgi:hypothetical protein